MEQEFLTTRDHILHHLRRGSAVTAKQLAQALSLSLSAVRQQLQLLEKEGLISPRRMAGGPGRPEHQYSLTAKAEGEFDKRYDAIATELLQAVVAVGGEQGLEAVLRERRVKQLKDFEGRLKEGSMEATLFALAQRLQDLGYMASVEVGSEQLLLKEHNCPYLEVAKQFPAVCESERRLYSELLGKEVEMRACQAFGDQLCTFAIPHSSSTGIQEK